MELAEDDQRSLIDADLRDKCNIRLIVHTDGGIWPTEIEIRTQIRNPSNVPALAGRITNDVPDIMGLDDETPRVMMSCGHAVGKYCKPGSFHKNNNLSLYFGSFF